MTLNVAVVCFLFHDSVLIQFSLWVILHLGTDGVVAARLLRHCGTFKVLSYNFHAFPGGFFNSKTVFSITVYNSQAVFEKYS